LKPSERDLRLLDNKLQREINYLITDEWERNLRRVRETAKKADNSREYIELMKANAEFQSFTSKKLIAWGMRRKFADSRKMAIGVAALSAVIGIGVFVMAKNATKDFGYRSND
jgi:hypothetical protein